MSGFRTLINSLVLVFLLFGLSREVVAHEGEHDEEEQVEASEVKYLPVKSRKSKGDRTPTSIYDESASRTSRAYRRSGSDFAFGLFVSQDFTLLSDSSPEEALFAKGPSSTNSKSIPHKSGDTHSDEFHLRGIMSCPSGARCHAGEDHSAPVSEPGATGAGSSAFSPVVTLKGGYELTRGLSLFAGLGTDFSNGLRDPTLGIAYLFPISSGFRGLTSFQLSLPVSSASRDLEKITTATLSVNTLYNDGKFFAGGGGFVAFSGYRPASAQQLGEHKENGHEDGHSAARRHSDTTSSAHTVPKSSPSTQKSNTALESNEASGALNGELVRTGFNAFMGLVIVDDLSATVGAGLGSIYREDELLTWVTDITVARLAYSKSGFMGAIAFSLLSDPSGTDVASFPTSPYLGFKLQYVFGQFPTLGIIGTGQ